MGLRLHLLTTSGSRAEGFSLRGEALSDPLPFRLAFTDHTQVPLYSVG